jgi:hypothetical protein
MYRPNIGSEEDGDDDGDDDDDDEVLFISRGRRTCAKGDPVPSLT